MGKGKIYKFTKQWKIDIFFRKDCRLHVHVTEGEQNQCS